MEAIIDCCDMVISKECWRREKKRTTTKMLLLLCLIGMTSSQSGIRILPDGGYSDIVVRIGDSVNQDYCSQYIKHLTVSSTTSPPSPPPPPSPPSPPPLLPFSISFAFSHQSVSLSFFLHSLTTQNPFSLISFLKLLSLDLIS